ncbi:MAG: hypothetical protein AAF399_26095 [Bacteroidota bacterium]
MRPDRWEEAGSLTLREARSGIADGKGCGTLSRATPFSLAMENDPLFDEKKAGLADGKRPRTVEPMNDECRMMIGLADGKD